MAIYRFDPKKMTINVGQWVCPESVMLYQGCGMPRKVTKVNAQMVSWEIAARGEDESPKTGSNAKKNIVYVADTEEEAMHVYELELARRKAVEAAKQEVNADYDAKVTLLIAGRGE